MRFMLIVLAALSLAATGCTKAYAFDFNVDPAGTCVQLGADGGTTANVTVPSGVQLQVRPEVYSPVRYRACSSASCTATSTDSLLDTDKYNDMCGAPGYRTLSFWKGPFDGGNPQICVYQVLPAMPGVCKQ